MLFNILAILKMNSFIHSFLCVIFIWPSISQKHDCVLPEFWGRIFILKNGFTFNLTKKVPDSLIFEVSCFDFFLILSVCRRLMIVLDIFHVEQGSPTHGPWPIHNRAVWAVGAQIILHKWRCRRTYMCRQPAQVELCARMYVPACCLCNLSAHVCRPAACAARFPSPLQLDHQAAKVGDRWSRTFGAVPPIISMVYIFL